MPARGRHRRHRPGPVSRASLTVTAGGAGLALPLMTAGAAHATPDGAERTVSAPQQERPTRTVAAAATTAGASSSRPERRTADGAEGADRADTREDGDETHEVVPGDTLSGIAREHAVEGGWQRLYERNRRVVGENPDLILPGQRLALEARTVSPAERSTPKDGPAPERQAPPRQQERKPAPAPPTAAKTGPAASAPVAGAEAGTPYRAAGSGWSSGYHTGVDFPVPTGTSVRAVSDGHVVAAGWAGAYGYQVVLRHDDGRYSQYAHLSAISVGEGGRVNAGQRIGRSGSTGNSTGPHLHFEVRTGPGYGSDIDPLAYLRGLGVTV